MKRVGPLKPSIQKTTEYVSIKGEAKTVERKGRKKKKEKEYNWPKIEWKWTPASTENKEPDLEVEIKLLADFQRAYEIWKDVYPNAAKELMLTILKRQAKIAMIKSKQKGEINDTGLLRNEEGHCLEN